MKRITVRSCGECKLYGECRVVYDTRIAPMYEQLKQIHKDCPLSEMPTREGAREVLEQCTIPMGIEEALDRLGYKEKNT